MKKKKSKSQLCLQVSVDLDLSRLEVEKHPVIAVLGGAVPTYGFVFFFSSVPNESVYCFNIAMCF